MCAEGEKEREGWAGLARGQAGGCWEQDRGRGQKEEDRRDSVRRAGGRQQRGECRQPGSRHCRREGRLLRCSLLKLHLRDVAQLQLLQPKTLQLLQPKSDSIVSGDCESTMTAGCII